MTSSLGHVEKCYICKQLLAVNEGTEVKNNIWLCNDDECKTEHEKQNKWLCNDDERKTEHEKQNKK